MPAMARRSRRNRRSSRGERPVTSRIVLDVPCRRTVNEAAPAADTASTGCHRVTRYWFLRRFTAVAFLWRPTFAWAVGGPGRVELSPNCDAETALSRGLFSQDDQDRRTIRSQEGEMPEMSY